MSALVESIALRCLTGDTDLSALVELQNQRARADAWEHVTSLAELRSDFQRPELNPAADVRLAMVGDTVLGFAALPISGPATPWRRSLELQSAVDAPVEVEQMLVQWSLQRAARLSAGDPGPVELLTFAPEPRVNRIGVLGSFGFEPVRRFVSLQCDLCSFSQHLSVPSRFAIRPLNGATELPAWTAAVNEAFADHWRFSELTMESAVHFLTHDPSYQAGGDLVAVTPAGEIAGICQCVLRRTACEFRPPVEGAIAWLGVRPKFRGQGLGKALLVSGLNWLAEHGVSSANLGVDADGAHAALALYRQVGFKPVVYRHAFCWRSCTSLTSVACSTSSHYLSPC